MNRSQSLLILGLGMLVSVGCNNPETPSTNTPPAAKAPPSAAAPAAPSSAAPATSASSSSASPAASNASPGAEAAGSKAWVTYHAKDGSFSFDMPGTPTEKFDASIKQTQLMLQDGQIVYGFTYQDAPATAKNTDADDEKFLNNVVEAMKKQGNKILSVQKRKMAGKVSFTIEFMVGGAPMKSHAFLSNGRFYQAIVIGEANSDQNVRRAMARRFYESIKLGDKPIMTEGSESGSESGSEEGSGSGSSGSAEGSGSE